MSECESGGAAGARGVPTREQVMLHIRARLGSHLHDDSGEVPGGIAIYSLSDPRRLRDVRYIGQTAAPPRRLLQHLGTARLWLPDETPWWVRSPRFRPLYEWIRELYQDGRRLPVMLIVAWVEVPQARSAERQRIDECLALQLPLLNVEGERLPRLRSA